METQTKTADQRCIEYLEELLGISVDESKFSIYHKSGLIMIRDSDMFHQIAQASGLSELRRGPRGPWYFLNTQQNGDRWSVGLSAGENGNFLNKYGTSYRFR